MWMLSTLLSPLGLSRSLKRSPSLPKLSTKPWKAVCEMEATKQLSFDFLTKKPYAPPSWASHLSPIPSHVFSLAHVCPPHNSLSFVFNLEFNRFSFLGFVLVNSVTQNWVVLIVKQVPTPIHKWNLPNLPKNTQLWIKVFSLSFSILSSNMIFILSSPFILSSVLILTYYIYVFDIPNTISSFFRTNA